jgi:transposase
VLRQDHKAGENLFVDWSGDTIPIHDVRGGPMRQAHLFVAVLEPARTNPVSQDSSLWIFPHSLRYREMSPAALSFDQADARASLAEAKNEDDLQRLFAFFRGALDDNWNLKQSETHRPGLKLITCGLQLIK